MAYKRKTRDEWEIIGHYPTGSEVVTTEDNWKECKVNLKAYRENELGTAFSTRKRRVPISS